MRNNLNKLIKVFFLLWVIFFLFHWGHSIFKVCQTAGSVPVTIKVNAKLPVRVSILAKRQQEYTGINNQWHFNYGYVKKIMLVMPKDTLADTEKVSIELGKRVFVFSRADLSKWRQSQCDSGVIFLEVPAEVKALTSVFSVFKGVMNYAGDGVFLGKVLLNLVPLLLWFGFLGAVFLYRESILQLILGAESRETALNSSRWSWLLAGFVILLNCLVFLEVRRPFYFNQWDNFEQFYPVILQACRSFTETGIFPTWNPCQTMGFPNSSMGVYALTYPLTYLSYFTARLLGSEYLTSEVFAWIHLTGGYFACYWAGRSAGLKPMYAVLGSLSFVLCGYNLVAGRYWYYMLPLVLWLPLLAVLVNRLPREKESAGWLWSLLAGLVLGVFFHAGNVQMWFYSLIFFCLAVLILKMAGYIAWKKVGLLVPALFYATALSAPLLVVQFLETSDIARVPSGLGISRGILSMLFPYPLASLQPSGDWGLRFFEAGGQVYYAGTVFILAAFLFVPFFFALLLDCKKTEFKKWLGDNVWFVCGLTAFVLALGNSGVLWFLLSKLPVFSKFTNPVKFLPFIHFFFALGAGLVLQRLFSQKASVRREVGFACVAIVLLLVSVALPKPVISTDLPYPSLPLPMMKAFQEVPQRISVIGPLKSGDVGYVYSLAHNFPSVYGIMSSDGFEFGFKSQNILAARKMLQNPAEAFQAYGIRWLVEYRGTDLTFAETTEDSTQRVFRQEGIKNNLKKSLIEKVELKNLAVWKLKEPSPLAFTKDKAQNIEFYGNGGTVKLSETATPQMLVINVLHRPWFRVYADGKEVRAKADEWGRMTVEVPAFAKIVNFQYSPPWGLGLAAGLVLLVFGLILSLLWQKVGLKVS